MSKYMLVGIVAFCVALMPASSWAATPVRTSQVNAALREAGLPVNEFSQRSFAAGIEEGHYRTFEHLVDAMKWHKAQGRHIASFGVFQDYSTHPPILLRAKGVVANLSASRLELGEVHERGRIKHKKFHVTKYTVLDQKLQRGSTVRVEYLPGTVHASRVINLAPDGLEDVWGPIGL